MFAFTSREIDEVNRVDDGGVARARTPVVLLGLALLICVGTVFDPPAGRFSWILEVGPGLVGIAVLMPFTGDSPCPISPTGVHSSICSS